VTDLFALRLRTMLWVEQTLAGRILPALLESAVDAGVVRGLERHLVETERHARTLERLVDGPPEESAALVGLKAEHDLAAAAVGLDDLTILAAAARVEHYEIAAYEWLVAAAEARGEHDVALQLEEILEQEQFALELGEQALARLLALRVETV